MVAYLRLIVVKVIGEFFFLFGLLAWIYGVAVQFVYPEWLSASLSHHTPWIRVDTFTMICFVVSAIGFIMWRLAKEIASSTHK
jgi:hypothetical protein